MTAARRDRLTLLDGEPDPTYSTWREVAALLWAVFWAGFTLVALYLAIPFIAVLAGRQ